MRVLRLSHILLPFGLALLMLLGLATEAAAQRSPFTDLPADHWAYPAVEKLIERGILSGYPDGSFRGSNLVTRYALAVSLAKALEGRGLTGGGTGTGDSKVKLTVDDLETLEGLIKEFSEELALVGVKTSAVEEQLEAQQETIDELDRRVTDLEEGDGGERRAVRVEDGRFRAIGYNKSALNGGVDTIINLGVDLNEDVEGYVGLRYFNVFDQIDNETFGTYQAYLRSTKAVGPIDNIRVGKMNSFLGTGTVLWDRREGIELTTSREDVNFELSYFDMFLGHVSTEILGDGRLGFYYMKQDKVANRRPGHLGVYAKGETGGLDYNLEFTEYDNDGITLTNMDQRTHSFYAGLGYGFGKDDNMKLRLGVLAQQEDYRAVAVDSDLRWQFKDGRVSPHHDLLQAIRDATPAGVDPDEVAGFRDVQIGLDFQLPRSRWGGWVNVDLLRGHTSTLNHADDDFNVYTIAVERDMGDDLEVQLRWQGIAFDNENGNATVDSIPALRRQDTSALRAQVVKRF